MIYYIGNSIAVDLKDLRSGNKIFDVLGCDGCFHMHLTDKKSNMRYLVGPQTLV